MSIFVKIVSASELVYEGEAVSVVLPAKQGDMEILPCHLPILTILTAGLVVVKSQNGNDSIAVSEGFARVHADHVDILVEEAVDVKTIDFCEVENGIERAKSAIQKARDNQMPDKEIRQLEAKLQYLFAKKLGKK